jgi:hypothetical protein
MGKGRGLNRGYRGYTVDEQIRPKPAKEYKKVSKRRFEFSWNRDPVFAAFIMTIITALYIIVCGIDCYSIILIIIIIIILFSKPVDLKPTRNLLNFNYRVTKN